MYLVQNILVMINKIHSFQNATLTSLSEGGWAKYQCHSPNYFIYNIFCQTFVFKCKKYTFTLLLMLLSHLPLSVPSGLVS